jgi:hypothetical protein
MKPIDVHPVVGAPWGESDRDLRVRRLCALGEIVQDDDGSLHVVKTAAEFDARIHRIKVMQATLSERGQRRPDGTAPIWFMCLGSWGRYWRESSFIETFEALLEDAEAQAAIETSFALGGFDASDVYLDVYRLRMKGFE